MSDTTVSFNNNSLPMDEPRISSDELADAENRSDHSISGGASLSNSSRASSSMSSISTASIVELVASSRSNVLSWWQSDQPTTPLDCNKKAVPTDKDGFPSSDCEQADPQSQASAVRQEETTSQEQQLPLDCNHRREHTKHPHEMPQTKLSLEQRIRCMVEAAPDREHYKTTVQNILESSTQKQTQTPETKAPKKGLVRKIKVEATTVDGLMDTAIYGLEPEEKRQQIKFHKAMSAVTDTTDCISSTDSSSDGSADENSRERNRRRSTGSSCGDKWASFVHRIGDLITVLLTSCAGLAARNPYICISLATIVSFTMVSVGLYTNFNLVVENELLWPPHSSFAYRQSDWLYEVSEFNYDYRNIDMVIHADGDNVLTQSGVARVFEAMSIIQSNEDYQQGCKWADLVGDANQVGECHTHSVTDFWNHSSFLFEQTQHTDADIKKILSATSYPNGEAVDFPRVIGNAQKDENGTLVSGQAFLVEFDLPWSYDTADFELWAINALLRLQKEWDNDDSNQFHVEILAYRSYEDEFMRAIILDLPLLPVVFMVVCLFCCLVFWRKDKVQSRCLLGIGAVVCIVLSIMASHGLMFICGVPFTTSTLMLPFLMFGVGLDDAFIIIGSYTRTQGTDIEKRIELTMKDISLSIGITTLTSALAFALGIFSDIPSVRWLCLYACPSILIDFFYQITFFIALVVLDERRIQENRRDCCACIYVKDDAEAEDEDESVQDQSQDECCTIHAQGADVEISVEDQQVEDQQVEDQQHSPWREEDTAHTSPLHELHWSDRLMAWYADKLLHPISQTIVMIGFVALLGVSLYFVFHLEQHFDMNDMVPHDSYLRNYYSSLKQYSKTRNGIPSYAFFRDLDQSQPEVQAEMIHYVDELAETGAIASPPANFWLRDFLQFTNKTADATNMTFSDQVELFLQDPLYNMLYDDHIVRNSSGDVVDSRCEIYINVDVSDAKGGVAALKQLRSVSRGQPVNDGVDGVDWNMFTYHDLYNIWEFYQAVVSELTLTTIIGIVAVSLVGFLLIPHWTAIFFVTPLIICLYIDLLGYMTYANVHVNAISYVQLVMSIGLMVDFIMHILIRYYESEGNRRERVKHTLTTMGASVFVGGISSLLGVSLLAFSTSQILQLVFVAVLGLVVLGILHGLVFLPVILSLIGPE